MYWLLHVALILNEIDIFEVKQVYFQKSDSDFQFHVKSIQ